MSKELADRQFEYLLNAMENAAQSASPALQGYGEKRKAVLDYVAALRSEPVAWTSKRNLDWLKSKPRFAHYTTVSVHPSQPHQDYTEPLYAAPSRETAKPEAEPALSAEQIEHCRRYGVTTAMRYALCDMALSSLTARDEGIEAAAKLIRKRLDGIYEDHAYTEQDTGATVIANAEIEGRANELEELEEEILALKGGK